MTSYRHLLAPGRIGPVETRNRIVMAPMGANLAEPDGTAGERMQRYFELRARGGVGLVIVDVAAVAWPVGVSNPFQLGVSRDDFIPGLRALAERVHAQGAKIAIQLHHGSKIAVRDIVAGRPLWVPSVPVPSAMDLYADLSSEDLEAATGEILASGNQPSYHEMSVADIAEARTWYAEAAARVVEAGFDGVELHAGHGYLLQSFLSPAANRRTDDYGGSADRRVRLLTEVLRDVRDQVGSEAAVWVRLDGCEYGIEGGLSEADAIFNARAAVGAGADAVHVSAYADPGQGALFTVAPLPDAPGAYVDHARAVRGAVDVPVIAVGRLEPSEADALVARGDADFVAMGRKLLADPELVNKLRAGAESTIRPCIYSYRCVGNVFLSKRSTCTVNPHTGREHERDPDITPTSDPRRVLVVGGGLAGMAAAREAAVSGHDVALVERASRLGGLARLAAHVDPAIGELVRWAEHELERLGVDVHLGSEADLAHTDADVVVAAIGAEPAPAPPGVLDLAALAERADTGEWPTGSVAVVGDDAIALQLAAHFARAEVDVTVCAPGARLGGSLAPPKLWRLLDDVRGAGAIVVTGVDAEAIGDSALRWRSGDIETETQFDAVVWLPARHPRATSVREHRIAVGDARAVRGYDGCLEDALLVAPR